MKDLLSKHMSMIFSERFRMNKCINLRDLIKGLKCKSVIISIGRMKEFIKPKCIKHLKELMCV